jgi:hypothetical protein
MKNRTWRNSKTASFTNDAEGGQFAADGFSHYRELVWLEAANALFGIVPKTETESAGCPDGTKIRRGKFSGGQALSGACDNRTLREQGELAGILSGGNGGRWDG